MASRRFESALARAEEHGRLAVHFPAIKRRTATRRSLDEWKPEVEAVWRTGARPLDMALHLGITYDTLSVLVNKLRKAGADLPRRERHHKPPPDWKQRLDDLKAEDCK